MSIRVVLATCTGTLAILVAGLVISAAGESQTPGVPLSKEEYQQQSLHFENEVSKADRLFYDLAVDPLPRAKCGAGARRYHAKLAAILTEAGPIIPPPEIADIHARLMAGARRIVRGVARVAKGARGGRFVCGDDIAHPAPNEVGMKINRVYRRSGFEKPLNQLYDLGYLLGGE